MDDKTVAEFLNEKCISETVSNIRIEEGSFNKHLFIDFDSGKTLEIEYSWIYKFAINDEEISNE